MISRIFKHFCTYPITATSQKIRKSFELEEPDPDAEPEGEDVVGVHHQLGPDAEEHTVATGQHDLSALGLVLQGLDDGLRVQAGQLDGECLERVLRRDVVFDSVLELVFAKGQACYSFHFVIGQGTGENTGQLGVLAEPQLVDLPKFLNPAADGTFDVVFDLDDIKSRRAEGNVTVVDGDLLQVVAFHALPQRAVLEVVLGARDGVIQLHVGVELAVVVHHMDGLVEIVDLGREEVELGPLRALPEQYRPVFGVLRDDPRVLPLVAEPDADVALQPEPQQQRAKQVAVVVHCALHAGNEAVESFVGLLHVEFFLLEGDQGTKTQGMLGRVNPPHIVEGGHEPAKWDEYLVVGVAIDLDPPGLESPVNLLIIIPESIGVGVELIVILFPVLDLLLHLAVDGHGLQHVQL